VCVVWVVVLTLFFFCGWNFSQLDALKGGPSRTRRAKKKAKRVQKYWSIAAPSKHTFKALLDSVPPEPENADKSDKKGFAGF
jgi:hypothetical protein